eukprot:365080-Chlamydomonas_euryale.AAC.3
MGAQQHDWKSSCVRPVRGINLYLRFEISIHSCMKMRHNPLTPESSQEASLWRSSSLLTEVTASPACSSFLPAPARLPCLQPDVSWMARAPRCCSRSTPHRPSAPASR